MVDRSRPSEARGVKRDVGGLSSFTINWERSRPACKWIGIPGVTIGFSSGMQDDKFTCTGDCIVTVGGSPDVGGEGKGCEECASWVGEDKFACKGVRFGSVTVGGSCTLERESGAGVVISNVDAAQSQLVDRAPYAL